MQPSTHSFSESSEAILPLVGQQHERQPCLLQSGLGTVLDGISNISKAGSMMYQLGRCLKLSSNWEVEIGSS